jgi:phosphoglycerate kinase
MQSTVAFKPAMAVRAAALTRASRPVAARPAAARAAPVAARTAFLSGSVAGSAASVRFVGKASGKAGFRLVTAMAKKSVGDLTEADLKGKVVFERADLNVPLDKELNITDDTRIRVRVPGLCAGRAGGCAG